MSRLIKPQVLHYSTPVREAHPLSQRIAGALGGLYGRAINGGGLAGGAVRFGYPQIGMREKFQGYVFPPQMFIGWNPHAVAGGTIRPTLGQLPGSQAPYGNTGPLLAAMAAASGPTYTGGVTRRG